MELSNCKNYFSNKKSCDDSNELEICFSKNSTVDSYLNENIKVEKRKRRYKSNYDDLEGSSLSESHQENFVPQKRKKSSEKERQRNLEIKAALGRLGRSMPFVKKDLSRIRTLRLAKEYIKHLKRILQGETTLCEFTGRERPLSLSDFERTVHREMQTNNSYKERAEFEHTSSSSQMSYTAENSPTRILSPTPTPTILAMFPQCPIDKQDSLDFSVANDVKQQQYQNFASQTFQNSVVRRTTMTLLEDDPTSMMMQAHQHPYNYIYYPMPAL